MSRLDPIADEFLPTRRSLVSRLKDWDDQEGWREFFETYWRLIYSVALKAGLKDPDAQDIVQETIVAVARKMRRFRYDPAVGSFKNWLMLVVRSRIADHFRRRRSRIQTVSAQDFDDGGTFGIDEMPDGASTRLEEIWEEEWQRGLLEAAIDRVRRKISPKHFQVFDLQARQDLSPAKISASLGISLPQVYLIKHRVARCIRKELALLEARML